MRLSRLRLASCDLCGTPAQEGAETCLESIRTAGYMSEGGFHRDQPSVSTIDAVAWSGHHLVAWPQSIKS